MTTKAETPKKTLYHSELIKMGPTRVTVKTDVMKSQYKGKPNYVVLIIDGFERNYTLDSEACENFFTGHKGETFTIEAVGEKGSEDINFLGDDDAPPTPAPTRQKAAPAARPVQQAHPVQQQQRPAAAPVQQQQQRTNQAPRATPEQALAKVRVTAARLLTLEKICHLAVQSLAAQWKERIGSDMPGDQYIASVGRMFIELNKRCPIEDLPKSFDFAQVTAPPSTTAAPAVVAQPEPQPELAQPEDENVPF